MAMNCILTYQLQSNGLGCFFKIFEKKNESILVRLYTHYVDGIPQTLESINDIEKQEIVTEADCLSMGEVLQCLIDWKDY